MNTVKFFHSLKRFIKINLICVALLFAFSQQARALSFDSIIGFFKEEPVRLRVGNHSKKTAQPSQVKIGVYVLHVGKYDLQSASIRMDFYLIFRCKALCNNISFEIMNATSVSSQLVAKQSDYLVYRVQADMNKANNLRNYPFDKHALDIMIENRQLTSDKMVFVADQELTALDNNLNVVGFQLLPNWAAQVTNHYYKVFQQSFSSYKFSMYIERPWFAGLLKTILPALIIVCCNFLALFMRIELTSQRLGVATSTLIAAEVFHLNVTSSIPPLGYATYADMFMLINYLFLLVVIIEVVATTYLHQTKHSQTAERVNKLFSLVIPGIWLVVQTINWISFHSLKFMNGTS